MDGLGRGRRKLPGGRYVSSVDGSDGVTGAYQTWTPTYVQVTIYQPYLSEAGLIVQDFL